MFTGLKKDKLLQRPSTWLSAAKEIGCALVNVGPFILRALAPSFNPRQESDPQWYEDWISGHANLENDDELPLIDTAHPEMPVPFAKAA